MLKIIIIFAVSCITICSYGQNIKIEGYQHFGNGVLKGAKYLPDGKHIITFGGKAILWNLETKEKIREYTIPNTIINSIDVSPDGETFVAGYWFDLAVLWDVEKGKIIRYFPIEPTDTDSPGKSFAIHKVEFHPDGSIIAISRSGYANNSSFLNYAGPSVQLFDVETGELIFSYNDNLLNTRRTVFGYTGFTQKEYYLLVCDSEPEMSAIIDVETNKTVKNLDYLAGIYAIDFFNNEETLLLGSYEGYFETRIFPGGELIKTHEFQQERPKTVHILSEKEYVLSSDYDDNILLWNPESDEIIYSLENEQLFDVSPNGKEFISFNNQNQIRIRELTNFSIVDTIDLDVENSIIAFHQFMQDENKLIVLHPGIMNIWNINKRMKVDSVKLSSYSGRDVSVSPNDKYIAVAAYDGVVRVYEISTGELVFKLEDEDFEYNSPQFTSNDSLITNDLNEWNIVSQISEPLFPNIPNIKRPAILIKYLKNEQKIIIAYNGSVEIRDFETGQLILTDTFPDYISYNLNNLNYLSEINGVVLYYTHVYRTSPIFVDHLYVVYGEDNNRQVYNKNFSGRKTYAASPKGDLLYAFGDFIKVSQWSTISSIYIDGNIYNIEDYAMFSNDGTYFYYGGRSGVLSQFKITHEDTNIPQWNLY